MPKELIRGDAPPYTSGKIVEPDGTEIEVPFIPIASVVDVRWDRESGFFQIATHSIDAVTGGYVMEYPKELRDTYGIPALLPDPSADTGFREARDEDERKLARMVYEREWVACQQGQYVTLDRRGINDLIKVLRRARDAAYGADA